MPPIMGAGGFLMAEMTEIPYVDIMKMAIFPAVMYFLSVFVMIHFEAKRYGLYGTVDPGRADGLADPQEGVVPGHAAGRSSWCMMLMGKSAGFSAVVGDRSAASSSAGSRRTTRWAGGRSATP